MVQHFILIEKTGQNQLRTIGSCRQPRQGGGQHLLELQEKDPVPSSPGTDVVVWLCHMIYRNEAKQRGAHRLDRERYSQGS